MICNISCGLNVTRFSVLFCSIFEQVLTTMVTPLMDKLHLTELDLSNNALGLKGIKVLSGDVFSEM